ncbi:hypothetical protein D3C85_1852300 [compost metagenome]
MATDSLLAQAAKAVIAVALVLIDEDTVVLDETIDFGPVKQVAGLIVLVVLNHRRPPVGA